MEPAADHDPASPLADHDPEAAEAAEAVVDSLIADVVSSVLDDSGDDIDLKQLHAQAVEAAGQAVAQAEADQARELAAMGERLRAEQEGLHRCIMGGLRDAVRQAAAQGQRVATLLRFAGSDRLGEFCYLYMLKGPHKAEHRAEMRAMGASPLLPRLRRELQAAGFGVFHAWQRATNENTLSITW